MLDIETLSLCSTPTLLQVSLLGFNAENPNGFAFLDLYPDLAEQDRQGAVCNQQTFDWWKQTAPVKFDQLLSMTDRISLSEMRSKLEKFIRTQCTQKVKIWAKSPSFDCAKINALWGLFFSSPPPWKYWQERDVRTLSAFMFVDSDVGSYSEFRHIWDEELLKGREAHDGLYDCFVQANVVIECHKSRNGKGTIVPEGT